jgi:hypothetical protein
LLLLALLVRLVTQLRLLLLLTGVLEVCAEVGRWANACSTIAQLLEVLFYRAWLELLPPA